MKKVKKFNEGWGWFDNNPDNDIANMLIKKLKNEDFNLRKG
jgi:hypothetical protein